MTLGRLFGALLGNGKARLGLVLLVVLGVAVVVGPWLAQAPSDFVGVPLAPPSADHLLGTTGQGQDVLAQLLAGGRVTLAVGFASGLGVVLIGALVGGLSAFLGGRADDLTGLLVNVFLVLPGLPLMVVLAAWLPPGPLTMLAVLVVTGWAWHARVLRSQVLSWRSADFVAASVVAGESPLRVLVAEILPNMASRLASSFIGATLYGIGAQVGLEYLGLGDLGAVTWGTNLYWAANDAALLTRSWWTFVPSGVAIAWVGFALTLVSFGLDEVTSPRLAAGRRVAGAVGRVGPGPTPVLRG